MFQFGLSRTKSTVRKANNTWELYEVIFQLVQLVGQRITKEVSGFNGSDVRFLDLISISIYRLLSRALCTGDVLRKRIHKIEASTPFNAFCCITNGINENKTNMTSRSQLERVCKLQNWARRQISNFSNQYSNCRDWHSRANFYVSFLIIVPLIRSYQLWLGNLPLIAIITNAVLWWGTPLQLHRNCSKLYLASRWWWAMPTKTA